jgi:hypothetical protein
MTGRAFSREAKNGTDGGLGNMTTDLAVGLDLGGTKTAAGVVTSQGTLLSNVRMLTPKQGVRRDLAALFDAAHAAVVAARVTCERLAPSEWECPGRSTRTRKRCGLPT